MRTVLLPNTNLTSPQSEQRVAMRASVQIDGKNVSVYNTHLSYESKEIRRVQLTEIAEWMNSDRNDYHTIVAYLYFNNRNKIAKYHQILSLPKTKFLTYS